MKKSFALCLTWILAVFLLAACGPATTETTADTTPSTEELRQLYSQAIADIPALRDFALDITIRKETTVAGYSFRETTRQQVSFLDYGQETMEAVLNETYQVGDHTTAITEYYTGGNGALVIGQQGFSAPMEAADYGKRFVPSVILTAGLYPTITLENRDGQQILTFSGASAAENWTGVSDYWVSQASGTAVIGADGKLKESSYRTTYPNGSATVTLDVTVKLDAVQAPQLPEFPDMEGYTVLPDLNAPKLLEQATGHLLQAVSLTAVSTESIVCKAGGLHRQQVSTLDLCRDKGDLLAQLARAISLTDESRGGATTTDSQVEKFLENVYSISANDGEAATKEDITAQHMLTYCQDVLVSTILLPKYLTGVTVTEQEDVYLYEFSTTAELSDVLMAKACKALYNDPDVLNNLASAYTPGQTKCYLTVHKLTGLPTSAGLSYSGTHTIAGADYLLSYQLDQVYDLTSQTAQYTITGQEPTPPETTVPDTTPSPTDPT